MACDWFPRTSRRPDPQEAQRRREKLYRDIGFAYVMNLNLALIGWPILGAVFLLLHLLKTPEYRLACLIALGIVVLPLTAWAFYIALRPHRPRRNSTGTDQ